MLKKIEECEIPLIKILLETLKEVSDFSAKLRTVFKFGGDDIEILDSDPFHAVAEQLRDSGDTMYYSRDGVLDTYFDYLLHDKASVDDVIEHIVEDLDALFIQYDLLGEDMYEPLDMEKYTARHQLENAS